MSNWRKEELGAVGFPSKASPCTSSSTSRSNPEKKSSFARLEEESQASGTRLKRCRSNEETLDHKKAPIPSERDVEPVCSPHSPHSDHSETGSSDPEFEGQLILDTSDVGLSLDMDSSLLITQASHSSPSSSSPVSSSRLTSTEDDILASNDTSLVKQLSSLLPVPEQSNNEPPEPATLLPPASVFTAAVPQSETASIIVSPKPELPIPFNPRNSSSPKGDEPQQLNSTTHQDVVEELLLEGNPLSKDSDDDEDLSSASFSSSSSKEFTYILDAPTACKFRKNEDPLTYINKDLFYGLSLEFRRASESSIRHGSTVTSLILMDFREQESREEALKTWSFWHSRQHSEDVRILDVEYNVVSGITGQPKELAYNAVSVQWSPDLGNAYIMVAVRCLSTDFSIQKGIKGIPLQLQVDTTDEFGTLISRGVCQVKVFCDKGAERKTREDLKRFVREIEKSSGPIEYCREGYPRSVFKPSKDMISKPMLFTPIAGFQQSLPNGGSSPPAPVVLSVSEALSQPPKRRRIRYREGGPDPTRIMIYVRQDSDDIFTALHVQPPSVYGLIQAISAKYQIDFSNIRHLYRRDLRGIIVKVDDDMLKFYCDEDAFLMKVLAFEEKNTRSMVHDIVLVDLKTSLADIRGAETPGSSGKDRNNNNSDLANG